MSTADPILKQVRNWLEFAGKQQLRRLRQAQARRAQNRFVKHYIAECIGIRCRQAARVVDRGGGVARRILS